MNRRFNYTNRRRIERADAHVAILEDGGAAPLFIATLRLSDYELPPDAQVFVEARRHTAWMRFDFGTVAHVTVPQPDRRRLTEFGSADGLKFLVKVVEDAGEAGDGCPARILAHADNIQPQLPEDQRDKAESLLPVISRDLNRQEVWRVDFDEGDEPALAIDENLVPNGERDALVRSPHFVALALPAVVRQILERILLVENHTDTEDGQDWRSIWLRFASLLPGAGDAPRDDSEPHERAEWIDSAVQAFGVSCGVGERFNHCWEDLSQ